MRNRGITQIGIIVKDIQESFEQYWDTFGIGPWSIYTFNQDTLNNFSVHGKPVKKPFKFVVAKCMCGNIDIELIQHIEGDTVYEDFIEEKGFDVIQSGKFGENIQY